MHVMNAYRHAVAQRYRFFSYGDAMFLERAAVGWPCSKIRSLADTILARLLSVNPTTTTAQLTIRDALKFELFTTMDRARRGRMMFPRGVVETPAFMPVGTYGTVKAMTPEELTGIGAQIILGNTFHLMLRPGMEVMREHGGLHRFMHWNGPILTDSGGFQVFSLATLRKITEEGVSFRSPINGDAVMLTPERSMQVQRDLDSDIVMIFDECTPYPATEDEARRSMELSLRWAARSRAEFNRLENPHALFGIVQGGMYEACGVNPSRA